MTDPQKRALAALYLLTIEPPPEGNQYHTPVCERLYFSRWEIGSKARHTCQGYPLKTMTALEVDGYVEPQSAEAVRLYSEGICRCGCDRWAITPKGILFCEGLNIVKMPNEFGRNDGL